MCQSTGVRQRHAFRLETEKKAVVSPLLPTTHTSDIIFCSRKFIKKIDYFFETPRTILFAFLLMHILSKCRFWKATFNSMKKSFVMANIYILILSKDRSTYIQSGAAHLPKSWGSKGSKTPLKFEILGFYCIFMWQFLKVGGAIAPLAPLAAPPL